MSKKNRKQKNITIVNDYTDKDLFNVEKVEFPGFSFGASQSDKATFTYNGRIIIPLNVYYKMFSYVKNISTEISGLGMVELDQTKRIIKITDVFIIKQEASSAKTKLDNEDLAKKTVDLLAEYDAGDKSKNPSNMKLWWHSHASGGVFWSSTDDDCCDDHENGTFLVSIVVNHKKELRCRLDIYAPMRITLDNIPVEIEAPTNYLNEIEDKCKQDMFEKVSPISNYVSLYNKNKYLTPDDKEMDEDVYNGDKDDNDTPDVQAFERFFLLNKPLKFSKLEVVDEIGFTWIWSIKAQEYFPTWKSDDALSKYEYALIALGLSNGSIIPEEAESQQPTKKEN